MKSIKQPQQQVAKKIIPQSDFEELIEDQVQQWLQNPSNHYKIEKAKNEGWLGYLHSKKDQNGLIGYLRVNFAKQIKIVNELDNIFPIYNPKLINFIRSDWFANQCLKNKYIAHGLILEKHFELLTTN